MRIIFVIISMICVFCFIVILDMLNTFIKNYNYFKSKVNNILSIIYKNDQITCCCFKCTSEMLFSHWLIWRWRLLNKHYRFRKMEMEVFVKIPIISSVAHNFLKRNEIFQRNILIYFKAIFLRQYLLVQLHIIL